MAEKSYDKESLDDLMKKSQDNDDLIDKGELSQVSKEISENKPSSSNLGMDEFRLLWRGKHILGRLSPKSVRILDDYSDTRRSVDGWTTSKKVEAIVGVQQQRSGNSILSRLFAPKQPGA